MIAVRQELPDGSIPLSEPTTLQPIIWTDPRDRDAERRLARAQTRPAVKSVDGRKTAIHSGEEDRT